MDEMTLLRELEPAEPTGDDLAGARSAVMAAVHAGSLGAEQVGRDAGSGRRRRPTRRLALAGVLLAAAATAIAVVVPGGGHGGIGTPAANADPITVLRQAARAASASPDRPPRPDQFLYVKNGSYTAWLSMDGRHDGAVADGNGKLATEPGCRHGVQLAPSAGSGTRSVPCTPDPAYIADAPTSTPTMVAYLNRRFGSAGANGIGKGIMGLLEFHYLRSAARAALFDATTHIGGLHLSTTGVGASAVGITWQVCSSGSCGGTMLLFDRSTHAYLGVETTGIDGELSSGTASNLAIVDHVGDRP